MESAFEPSPDITKSTVSISSQPSTSSSAVLLDASASNEASASATAEAATSEDGAVDSDAWKDDYEKYLQFWQAESAVARRKAEETREMWEKRRAEEKKAGKERKDDWESFVTPATTPPPEKETIHHRSKTCAADGRDFVPGAEAEKGSGKETLEVRLLCCCYWEMAEVYIHSLCSHLLSNQTRHIHHLSTNNHRRKTLPPVLSVKSQNGHR